MQTPDTILEHTKWTSCHMKHFCTTVATAAPRHISLTGKKEELLYLKTKLPKDKSI